MKTSKACPTDRSPLLSGAPQPTEREDRSNGDHQR